MSERGAPFELDGDPRGVLLVHGFTGSPFEMSYLGRRLHERGMTVYGPLLPGHGTDASALHGTSWEDWYGAVEAKFDQLRSRCRRVAVVGQSLGGLLALHLAARRGEDVAAAGALAVPLWLGALPTAIIRLARRYRALAGRIEALPKLGGSDVRDRAMRRANPAYRQFPLRGLLELDAIMERVRGELHEVRVPLLVLHGRRDHTAPLACSGELARRAGSRELRRRVLERSYHLIALDVERDLVAAEVGAFVERHLAAEAR